MEYEKAFDSIDTWADLDALQQSQIDERYIEMLRCFYRAASKTVEIYDQKTYQILFHRGVKQTGLCSGDDITTHAANSELGISGVRMNFDKTKVMLNVHVVPKLIFVARIALEPVQKYIYGKLSSLVHTTSTKKPTEGFVLALQYLANYVKCSCHQFCHV